MATPPQAIKTSANPWLVLVFLSLGYFMIPLDTTIVNIAIPSIIPALRRAFTIDGGQKLVSGCREVRGSQHVHILDG
jgi:hypothetical protein